ncbi:MAG: hypothetical protein ACI4KN_03415, partial [Gemmiger sp.]
MKNKIQRDMFVIVLLLLTACIALMVPLAFMAPQWLIAPAIVVVFVLILLGVNIRSLRRFVARNLSGTNFEGSKTQYSVAKLPVPVALISGKNIVWYNASFREEILNDTDAILAPAERLLPGVDLSVCSRAHGQD